MYCFTDSEDDTSDESSLPNLESSSDDDCVGDWCCDYCCASFRMRDAAVDHEERIHAPPTRRLQRWWRRLRASRRLQRWWRGVNPTCFVLL